MSEESIGAVESPIFRRGGISYIRMPSHDPAESAAFYHAVFAWTVHPERDSFEDGTGHVIGHWMTDLPVVGAAGVVPYIFVANVDDALASIGAHGGETVTSPYPEGDLWVATFRDPTGNVLGVWQHGPRG